MVTYCQSIKDNGETKYYISYDPLYIEVPFRSIRLSLRSNLPVYDLSNKIIAKKLNVSGRDIIALTKYPNDIDNLNKIIKCGKSNESIDNEILNYDLISKINSTHFPKYYGSININNNKDKCILIEFIENSTTIENYFNNGFNNITKHIIIQAYEALDQLHSVGIIHDDLGNPNNIIIKNNNGNVNLYIIDLESDYRFNSNVEIDNDTLSAIQYDNNTLTFVLFNMLYIMNGDENDFYELEDEININDNYGAMIPYLENMKTEDNKNYIDIMINRIN